MTSHLSLPIIVLPCSIGAATALQPEPSIPNGLTFHASSDQASSDHASSDHEPRPLPRCDPKKRGEASEAAFLARATDLGFSVLHPWGDSNRYDAAIDSGRMILRMQVKSAASFRNGRYSVQATRSDGHVYTVEEIDFLAGYVIPENIWYIIPAEAIQGHLRINFRPHSRHRRVKPFFERYREAWCLLDCPRKVRGWMDIPVLCRSRDVGVRCAVCPLHK